MVLSLGLVGCGHSTSAASPYGIVGPASAPADLSSPAVSQEEWSTARDRLARVRHGLRTRPYVERVRVEIAQPTTGKRYVARGAVAIHPDHAARMILIGPGGTTAIDLWVTKDRFRFSVPAIHLDKRGGADPSEARGLPVGMLRWWFLSPLAGRLLVARAAPSATVWVLRDGDGTVTLRSDGHRFVAQRRSGEGLEGIEWISQGVLAESGAHGRYIDGRLGLAVEVLVEDVIASEPDPAAFADPDDVGTAR